MGDMKKLLIVDDSELIIDLLTEILSGPEITIEVAVSGVDAVTKARAFRPDVILLDVGLDDIDGFEVFRILKQDTELNGTRIIFMTGHAERGALEIARDLGAFDFLVKPIPVEDLERTIARALDPATASAGDTRAPPPPLSRQEGDAPGVRKHLDPRSSPPRGARPSENGGRTAASSL